MRSSYEDFLQRLTQYRQRLNMTQEETSKAIGVTQSQFSKMELGKTIVSYKCLQNLVRKGWDIDYLLTGKEVLRTSSEMTELLMHVTDENRQEFLRAVAWILEQAVLKCVSDVDFETKCEIEILKREAGRRKTDSVLYEIRKMSGISQIPMAERLGVNIKKYRMLEKNKVHPDAELLLRIYEVTGCKPSLLVNFGNVENMIIDDLWRQINQTVREKILLLSGQIIQFLNM
ncbi:MAG: helix-turn-helix domain-containing protein [Suilimivivens sp.]